MRGIFIICKRDARRPLLWLLIFAVLVAITVVVTVLVLVDDEACVGSVVALQKLFHAVLNGFDAMLVVFDDHDDLGRDAASEGGVGHEHNRRCVDDNQVVVALEFFDQVAVTVEPAVPKGCLERFRKGV